MFQIKVLFFAVIAVFVLANTYAKQIEIEPRIINGHDAERGQFPFYVYLEVITSAFLIFEAKSSCGATLITHDWVITAGHCVSTKESAQTLLHFGSLRSDDTSEVGRKIIEVKSSDIYLHPDYSVFLGMLNPKNDIALIKLPSPVEFNEYIRSIPLACPKPKIVGTSAVVVGNGITNSQKTATILQYANLKISKERPNIIFAKGLSKESIKSGDSGGPLVALTAKGEIHGLIGIVSFENLLIDEQGFARIGAFFDWVLSTTGIKTCVW